MKKYLLIIAMLLLLVPLASAQKQYHLKLLAVSEGDDGLETGNIADVYLELNEEGKGRVFLETFPMTKVDTQISTRFAKEIACDYSEKDCSKYDFIYTIKAGSSIVGGPSAGGAISVLTVAAINDLTVDEKVAMTGTINSGGMIGPVGGIKQKIEAAAQNNITKVLIPKGKGIFTQKSIQNQTYSCSRIGSNIICDKVRADEINKSIDLIEYGGSLGVEVIEVSTLDEAVYYITGKKAEESGKNITLNEDYVKVMRSLAELLCNRTNNIYDMVDMGKVESSDNRTKQVFKEAVNLTKKSEEAFDTQKYYSSASYCFGANAKFGEVLLYQMNASKEDSIAQVLRLKKEVKDFDNSISERQITTITDLEAFMVVKQRIAESEDLLDDAEKRIIEGRNHIPSLALAIERIYSANAWSRFFGAKGKEFQLEKKDLEESCNSKILEAEERYQYISLFLPEELESQRKQIDNAYRDRSNGDFELCLFKAAEAKAEIDSIMNLMGVEENEIDSILDDKLDMIKKEIAKQGEKNSFPILGYSYFEYSESLRDSDKFSALLYAEYALELSDLDIYFKEKQVKVPLNRTDYKIIVLISTAIIIGIIIGYALFYRKKEEIVIKIN